MGMQPVTQRIKSAASLRCIKKSWCSNILGPSIINHSAYYHQSNWLQNANQITLALLKQASLSTIFILILECALDPSKSTSRAAGSCGNGLGTCNVKNVAGDVDNAAFCGHTLELPLSPETSLLMYLLRMLSPLGPVLLMKPDCWLWEPPLIISKVAWDIFLTVLGQASSCLSFSCHFDSHKSASPYHPMHSNVPCLFPGQ